MTNNTFIHFIFILFSCLLVEECLATPDVIINDQAFIEFFYNTKIYEAQVKPNDLCNLPKDKKHALCDIVIRLLENHIKVPAYGLDYNIYLNKFATNSTLEPKCVKNKLHFQEKLGLNEKDVTQDMFPCYGRNRPMRTAWHVDDNFDALYLNGNFDKNKSNIFVYIRIRLADNDVFEFYKLVQDIDVPELQSLEEITDEDLNSEVMSLREESYNELIPQIESNYIRKIINAETELRNPICDLPKKNKIALCGHILKNLKPNDYVHNLEAYEMRSMTCYEGLVEFWTKSARVYNYINHRQLMYPCPETADRPARFYLSSGYRDNSVLVLASHGLIKTRLLALVENVSSGIIHMHDRELDDDKMRIVTGSARAPVGDSSYATSAEQQQQQPPPPLQKSSPETS